MGSTGAFEAWPVFGSPSPRLRRPGRCGWGSPGSSARAFSSGGLRTLMPSRLVAADAEAGLTASAGSSGSS